MNLLNARLQIQKEILSFYKQFRRHRIIISLFRLKLGEPTKSKFKCNFYPLAKIAHIYKLYVTQMQVLLLNLQNRMSSSLKKKQSDKFKKYYTVKNILDYEVAKGVQWFLLEWQGYSKAEATWETLESLNKDFQPLIEQWRQVWRLRSEKKNKKDRNFKDDEDQIESQRQAKGLARKEKHQNKMCNKLIQYVVTHELKEKGNTTDRIKQSQRVPQQIKLQESEDYVYFQGLKPNQKREDLPESESQLVIPKKKRSKKNKQIRKILTKRSTISIHSKNKIASRQSPSILRLKKKIASKKSKISLRPQQKPLDLEGQKKEVCSLSDLPIKGIRGKSQFNGKVLFQIELGFGGKKACDTAYFQKKCVKNYWPEFLTVFEQKNRQMQDEQ